MVWHGLATFGMVFVGRDPHPSCHEREAAARRSHALLARRQHLCPTQIFPPSTSVRPGAKKPAGLKVTNH
jgi:hypothetical protein